MGLLGALAGAQVTLFEKGDSELKIYLKENASAELVSAAQDLSEILFSMSGARLPIEKNPSENEKGIFLSRLKPGKHLPPPVEALEAFKIWTDTQGLHLSGYSDLGITHAIYTFLQQHGGCRWYTPGTSGEYIPKRKTWKLKEIDESNQPDFLSREFFGLNSKEEKEWARRNRLHGRFEYHHNLYTIFDENVFENNPEWFALIGEERRPPQGNERTAQPNFSDLNAADYAAHVASEYFKENPEALSFSLGMNDGLAIDTSEATRLLTEPIQFYRNNPDYSDLVFRFMNRASDTLSKTFPQKYLGCLAYHYALNVPSFRVSPKIIPYITADRSQWYDKSYREADLDLMKRWAQAGPEIIGIYDYYGGHPFIIPRIFTRYIHESLRFAYNRGIRGFTAELYPVWPFDGPKAWLTAQLLWDTGLNRIKLLDDFYKNVFGKAAKPMEHFYSLCEEAWSRQPAPGWWLKFYKNPEQTEIFSKTTFSTLEDLLVLALEKADAPRSKHKIEQTIQAFKKTLVLAKLNKATQRIEQLGTSHNSHSAIQAINNYYETLEYWETETEDNKDTNAFSPRNPIPSTFNRLRNSPVLKSREIHDLVQQKGAKSDLIILEFFLRELDSENENILRNVNLAPQDWYALDIPEWNQFSWPTPEGTLELAKENLSEGVLAKNQKFLSLEQVAPINPGSWYMFSAKAKGSRSRGGNVTAFIRWISATGASLGQTELATLPQNQSETYPLTVAGRAPKNAFLAAFSLQITNQTENDWAQLSEAFAMEIAK